MSLAEFKQAPWRFSHGSYQDSVFAISPAPEYASSEVLLASLYRTIGYASASEGSVPQAGRDLDKNIQKLRERRQSPPSGAVVNVEAWNTVLHGILESPKLPNQSSKRFLQITPIVPGTALFSGSARLSSNSWPAGSLIRRMVCLGSKDRDSAQKLWKSLFTALSVNDDDDVFARWLDQETSAWNTGAGNWDWSPIPESEFAILEKPDFQEVPFLPARRFSKDLHAIMQAKGSMTRRQWTSLLEAVLRLAAASHVTWLCDVHARIWTNLSAALADGPLPSSEREARQAIFPEAPQYMAYGGKALQGIKDKVSSYLNARLGTNALLWSLEQIGAPLQRKPFLECRYCQALPACTHTQGRACQPGDPGNNCGRTRARGSCASLQEGDWLQSIGVRTARPWTAPGGGPAAEGVRPGVHPEEERQQPVQSVDCLPWPRRRACLGPLLSCWNGRPSLSPPTRTAPRGLRHSRGQA